MAVQVFCETNAYIERVNYLFTFIRFRYYELQIWPQRSCMFGYICSIWSLVFVEKGKK